MAGIGINIGRSTLDDFFKTDEGRKTEEIKPVKLEELKPFVEQPFKVLEDESMDELVESIKQNGVLSPIVTRPHPEGGYEILSGHRRARACEIAGITEIPAVVKNLDDDTAIILLVDSNLQREHILPSEKAKAYKLKMEAMKKQGKRTDLTSCQLGTKLRTDEEGAENASDSARQIQRYIRLNNLLPELLQMVDEERIALTPAVELSYLTEDEQKWLLETIETEEATPSLSQAQEMKNLSQAGILDMDQIFSIMVKPKANQKEVIKIKVEAVDKYLKGCTTPKEREDFLLRACEYYSRFLQRQRNKDRDAR